MANKSPAEIASEVREAVKSLNAALNAASNAKMNVEIHDWGYNSSYYGRFEVQSISLSL